MKVAKRILMGLGAVLLFGVAAFTYVAWDARSAEQAGKKFISSFLSDFSGTWALADVESRVTADNVEQLRTGPGAQILRDLSKLGKFKSIEQLTLVGHLVSPQRTITTFDFVGVFENGAVFSRFTLVDEDETVRVKDMAFRPAIEIRRLTASCVNCLGVSPNIRAGVDTLSLQQTLA